MNRANANKHMSFPSVRHVASLLLNTKHLGSLRNTFYLSILSPCGSDILWCDLSLNDKLWCDLSLPLWHQFPRRAFWNLSWMGLVLESQHKAMIKMWCLYRTRFIKWSWIRRNSEYVAKSFSCYEIGGTEWYASVVSKRFGWTENNISV